MKQQHITPHAKKSIVLGLGKSGIAAARLLQHLGHRVILLESHDTPYLRQQAQELQQQGVETFLGNEVNSTLDSLTEKCDSLAQIVISPGIPPDAPLVETARSWSNTPVEVIGEVELASRHTSVPIIAITGTNGKTTTTELTTALFQAAGKKAIACGNIGYSLSQAVLEHPKADYFIAEVSSFQLETTSEFHPTTAVWLNFSPNHLDRHHTMKAYQRAKEAIFQNQNEHDTAIVPPNLAHLVRQGQHIATFSSDSHEETTTDFNLRGETIYHQDKALLSLKETILQGKHNAENIMASLAIAWTHQLQREVPLETLLQAIKNYHPPAHRCELCSTQNNITWINDSKATTLDAMEQAIKSIPTERTIILIAGGKDKGSSFAPLYPLIRRRVRHLLLLGEIRQHIISVWPQIPYTFVRSMEEAVAIAHHKALPGETILLSPGTSSYDMFMDYQERGNAFKKALNALFPSPPHS